jgi:hypothetical protein
MSFYANTQTKGISLAELSSRTPAAFATRPHEKCSARYGYIDTQRLLNYFMDEGYSVAESRGGLRGSSRDYGMHTIRMRAPSTTVIVGDLYPEIVLTNSHDKSSRAILDLGIYRGACSNGLVVGTSAGLRFSIPHVGDQREAVIAAATKAMEYVPRLQEVVGGWSQRWLTKEEMQEFNRRALIIKPSKGEVDLTMCRRTEDSANHLWNVFNRVQENALNGGMTYRSAKGRHLSTRPVGSVRKALDTNQRLWELAEEFLPN